MPSDSSDSRPQILARFRSLFAEADPGAEKTPRASKRVKLPIPVRLQVGLGELEPCRVRDVSLHGLCIESGAQATPGAEVMLYFDGYPEICDPFVLSGRVVRTESEPQPAVALVIDREANSPAVLEHFRRLVLHYLHHRPLLDEVAKGFSEARCLDCGWIGRVGERNPRCSRCGGQVRPVTRPPDSA